MKTNEKTSQIALAVLKPSRDHGISIYNQVLIEWDEDYDRRVLYMIDRMAPDTRKSLLMVGEHKASLHMTWSGQVPVGYEEGREIDVLGDNWQIEKSITAEGLADSSVPYEDEDFLCDEDFSHEEDDNFGGEDHFYDGEDSFHAEENRALDAEFEDKMSKDD